MVYPRRDGSRSLAKFIAVCAVTTCLLQSGAAANVHKVAPPVVAPTCQSVVTEGDAAVGIQIVTDSSCASGGVGCIDDFCRYCKSEDTPQSSHFVECSKIGWTEAPATSAPADETVAPVDATSAPADVTVAPSDTTPAPAVETMAPVDTTSPPSSNMDTGCDFAVSDGDYSVGIELVGDKTCVDGGVGCLNDDCRYCMFRETAQSGHLLSCSSLGFMFGDSSSPSATPVAPGTNGSGIPPAPIEPPATTEPVDTGCPYAVSDGDAGVGIQLVGDATCAGGGLGCFADVCRYCQTRNTPQSGHLMLCKDLGVDFGSDSTPAATTDAPAVTTEAPTESPVVATIAPAPTTEAPVATTEAPAATTDAPVATTEAPVATTEAPIATTEAPVATTEAPITTTDAPVATTETPAATTEAPTTEAPSATTEEPTFAPVEIEEPPTPTTAAPSTNDCPFQIAEGDYGVGIELVGDASCVSGGLGCYQDVCRFCRYRTTPQSGHLMACSDLGYDLSSGSNADDTPTDAPEVPTADPVTACPYPVMAGDAAVGIQLVGDAGCASGGLGCFKDVCRYCKLEETPQSKHLISCSDLGYPHSAEEPTFAPVEIIDETPAPTTVDDTETPAPTTIDDTETPAPTTVDDSETPAPAVDDGSNDDTPTDAPGVYDGSNDDDDETPEPTSEAPIDETPEPTSTEAPAEETPEPTVPDATPEPTSTDAPAEETPEPTVPDATPEPATESPNLGTGCAFPITEGDYGVGIQLVGDASCVSGGLGCYQDVCRYCRYRTTPQSAHFVACKDLGYDLGSGSNDDDTPTDAPEVPTADPETRCPYPATAGDAAVGIQLVGDAGCASGGLGCFKDVCRYCKLEDTPQSKHLLPCSDLGYPHSTEEPTFAPVDIIDETSAPTTPPPTTEVVTEAPAPSTAPPAPTVAPAPSTNCDFPVSEGDYSVGIELVGDATCASGGLGCFQDVCRHCQFRETPQSAHLMSCAALGYDFGSTVPAGTPSSTPSPTNPTGLPTTCPLSIDEGDFSVGIQLLTDHSCVNGGVGCVADVCRFCKFRETPQSSHLLDCASFSAASPAPSDGIPIGNPTDLGGSNEGPAMCPFTASEGDLNIGVEIITDMDCLNDDNGCFNDVCRFCQFFTTDKSAHLPKCSDYGYNFEPIATSKPPLPGSPTVAPAPATPAPVSSVVCDQAATEGDKTIGIDMVTDPACLDDSTGCLPDSVCRYCKFMETSANSGMEWCSAIVVGYTTSAPATVAPTEAPPISDSATPAPAPSASALCDQTVSEGDKSVGTDMVTDMSCLEGGVGCLPESVCRYCKAVESSANAHMLWCSEIVSGYTATAPVAGPAPDVAPSPATVGPAPVASTSCDQSASEGDKSVGIDMETFASCAHGGLGCIADSVCRYCKRTETGASQHLDWCATSGAATEAPTAPPAAAVDDATPAPTLDPAMCSTEVSSGDAEGGVAAVHDETCLGGGLGCFGGVCRFCRVFESDKSANFIPCESFVPTIAPLRAAAKVTKSKSSKSAHSASNKTSLDELLKDKTFKWSIIGAACVGVVAVVALVALAAKRTVSRRKSRKSSTEESTTETEADVEADAATVTATVESSEDAATVDEAQV